MASWHQLQRAIYGDIIKKNQNRHHVHIGMRIEGKILMIFDLSL